MSEFANLLHRRQILKWYATAKSYSYGKDPTYLIENENDRLKTLEEVDKLEKEITLAGSVNYKSKNETELEDELLWQN